MRNLFLRFFTFPQKSRNICFYLRGFTVICVKAPSLQAIQYNTIIQTLFLKRRLHQQPPEGALHSSVYNLVLELSSKYKCFQFELEQLVWNVNV